MNPAETDPSGADPIRLVIEETFDLHGIRPSDVKESVREYLRLAHEKAYRRVRIIHGKGMGERQRMVHHLLLQSPLVSTFCLAPPALGGWGATVIWLVPSH